SRIRATVGSTSSGSTVSGSLPSRPSSTALGLPWPCPVAPSEPYSSARTRSVRSSRPSWSSRSTKLLAARIGPTVCELDGPMPTLNRSKTLSATAFSPTHPATPRDGPATQAAWVRHGTPGRGGGLPDFEPPGWPGRARALARAHRRPGGGGGVGSWARPSRVLLAVVADVMGGGLGPAGSAAYSGSPIRARPAPAGGPSTRRGGAAGGRPAPGQQTQGNAGDTAWSRFAAPG